MRLGNFTTIRQKLECRLERLAVSGAGPENGRSVNLGRLLMFPIVLTDNGLEPGIAPVIGLERAF